MTSDIIFIVDDDPIVINILIATLHEAGYEAKSAQNGADALQEIELLKPDLILLDVMMPKLDGFEICRRLKAKPQTQEIPVIFMTALEDRLNEFKGFEMGAIDYIIKPFSSQKVLLRVKTHLTLRKLQKQLREQNDELEKQVKVRTAELEKANITLKAEFARRQQAEEGLWKTAARFRSLIEYSSDIVTILSPEGCFHYLSPSATRILGYMPEEMIGKALFEFVHPADATLVANMIKEALDQPGRGLPEVEFRLQHHDGSWHTLAATLTNLFVDPTVNGLLANCHDITERKHLEEQYRQAQKMEAIGLLAGGIAHDFNNLLTLLMGHTDLALELLPADHPAHSELQGIQKASARAANLTRQLLAFARKQIAQPKILDLNDLVSNMDKMLRRLIGEDIDLITVQARNLGQVKADPGQLEQVLMNLVVNARDAMPQGGRLIIQTANVELDQSYTHQNPSMKPGPYVLLTVSDTGCGMDETTKTRLFEPFFTTKEVGQGTGLGLATVHGIINQSGGHIQVYSEPGQGSTFKIYLPQLEQEALTYVDQMPAEWRQGSETVLLVEDEVMVRNLIRRVLLEGGYKVLEANHGAEALQICEQYSQPIHLLITDLVMPGGLDGRQLVEQLLSLRPELKVLYISGYPDQALAHHGLPELQTEFLSKPFRPGTLIHKLRYALTTAQQKAPSRTSPDV